MAKLTQKDKVNIIKGYTELLTPMIELAKRYNVSRHSVYKMLRVHNVDTSKRKLPVSCDTCRTIIYRTKAKIRNNTHQFCDLACWHAWLDANKIGILNRHGMRLARKEVSHYFDLQPEHVVHHIDGNNIHNHINNLLVFACTGDHVRYHRQCGGEPIFDGRKVNA